MKDTKNLLRHEQIEAADLAHALDLACDLDGQDRVDKLAEAREHIQAITTHLDKATQLTLRGIGVEP